MSASAHVHLDLELIELLTGETDPDGRRAVLDALRVCDVCRMRADELAATMTDAVAVAPAVTPPLGFETRVAARLAEAVPAMDTVPRSRRTPRWWPLATAAAALAIVALALGTLLISRLDGGGNDGALALVRSGTDETVGTVTFTEAPDGPVMIVALLDAPADIAYRCRLRMADGTVVDSPAWLPMRRGAWVLDVPGAIDDVERVEIIAAGSDIIWSSADA